MESEKVRIFIKILRDIGANDYEFTTNAKAKTKYMLCLRLPNGIPFGVQLNTKDPRVWMASKDAKGFLKVLGKPEPYPHELDNGIQKGSHSALTKMKEFRIRPDMVMVIVNNYDPASIKSVFAQIQA